MSQEQVVSVRLRRGATGTPWGFRMQGGHEYGSPLYIQHVNARSLSSRYGLHVGDRLLAIGPVQAHNMSHEQAKMEILRAGNELDLMVQRNASAVIKNVDQPDSRQTQRTTDAFEEPTEYRGYTNPQVQSRSFKILQESLSYSEADEEGIVLPTGSTPGEGIVRKAYSEGRRRLEELSEINPRNFTADGQSPYRYSEHYLLQDEAAISPDVPSAAPRERKQKPDSTLAASKVYDGKEVGGSPKARPQVDIAGSSVLSPVAGQKQYLQQARKHYQEYYQDDQPVQAQQAPVVHSQPIVHNVQPAPQQVVHEQESGNRPLKLVNYHFEEQYGQRYQDPVVSPQKSNDFIPATQTVSSVAADLDLKIISPDTDPNQVGAGKVTQQQAAQPVVVQTQKTETKGKRVRQRTRGNTSQTSSTVAVTTITQQSQVTATTQIDKTDGCLMSKIVSSEPSPVIQAPSAQPVQKEIVQQTTVTQEIVQPAQPVLVVQEVKEPAPVLASEVIEPPAQPVPVVQEVKEPAPVLASEVIEPPAQPVPVVQEEVKEPAPVLASEFVEPPAQPILVVQEEVKEPAPIEQPPTDLKDTQAAPETQEAQPAPVVQEAAQPVPVQQEVTKPASVSQDTEQTGLSEQEVQQPSPKQEPEQVSQTAQEITEPTISQVQEQSNEAQVSVQEAPTSDTIELTVAETQKESVQLQPVTTEVSESIEIDTTTTVESQTPSKETTEESETKTIEIVAESPVEESNIQIETVSQEKVVVDVESGDTATEQTLAVQESTSTESVGVAISSTPEESSESVSLTIDTSANSENTAAFEITSDAEVSLNVSSGVTISTEGSDFGNTESEATTIVLSPEITETVETSADTEVSLSISSEVTITADEPTNTESEAATIRVEPESAENASVTIDVKETKSSESESESKPKKNKPMGQKLMEQRQNENSKPAKVRIVDSQGGVAARLARFKQK